MTEQQSKMGTCNKEAGDKKLEGDARKKFMSECLSANKKPTQQEKMTTCNKEAGDKKLAGDERKKFMSDCLSADKLTQQEKMTDVQQAGGRQETRGR